MPTRLDYQANTEDPQGLTAAGQPLDAAWVQRQLANARMALARGDAQAAFAILDPMNYTVDEQTGAIREKTWWEQYHEDVYHLAAGAGLGIGGAFLNGPSAAGGGAGGGGGAGVGTGAGVGAGTGAGVGAGAGAGAGASAVVPTLAASGSSSLWRTVLPYLMQIGGSALAGALAPEPWHPQERRPFTGDVAPDKLLGETETQLKALLPVLQERATTPRRLPHATVTPLGQWAQPAPDQLTPGATPTLNPGVAPGGVPLPQAAGAAQLFLHAMTDPSTTRRA